ncbi:tyrosine-type recombinase/integrase [Scytonema sp. UIC 10036]|uniref:tyrosine-type recombinase/integrase n=1 Tax=Scytonema sp. UIC 10036 TaxID=2304196 RepID=UPI0012DA40F3|nr:tyrosine-type recombinase/integrase [Scytonema sp. UIC 10036]MUH00329.1 tyrosine-type recombinase/integrase [Scytonema sp. UIC 10036]
MTNLTHIESDLAHFYSAISNCTQALSDDPDVLALLLEDKRSDQTKRAYATDVRLFFGVFNLEPTKENILAFLKLPQHQALQVVLKFKAELRREQKAEATINRRLSAIKSLAKMGRKLGICSFTLEDVDCEKVVQYRDTTGIDVKTFASILAQCDRADIVGKRNYALLRLLWGNALRRTEVVNLSVSDFDPNSKTLKIYGKGKGNQQETIDLGESTVTAIVDYLNSRPNITPNSPLFVSVDNWKAGNRLSGDGVFKILDKLCKAAGITKQMSPHRIRHSAITAALDSTGGNVRKVQKLSRHSKIETLMRYDDNRQRVQGEMTDLLDNLV